MANLAMGDGFHGGPFPQDQVLEGYDLHVTDSDYIRFGDLTSTGDAYIGWDGTNLVLLPAVDDTGAFNIGDGTTDMDVKIFLGSTSDYVLFDKGLADFIIAGAASVQTSQTGSGYSFNLVSVTADGASNNTRGWRVNMTTTASQTQGDLQCVHGYLTTGASVTLGANAAVYPLSAWLDVPSDITTGSGNVLAGVRAIFQANGVDLSALAGGGESALFYGQTWSNAGTAIEHGLRIVAGASTTIKNAISVGGTGTHTQIIDLTDWGADTTLRLVIGGPKDSTATAHWGIFAGDANGSAAAILADAGASAYGSVYFSTAGEIWYNKAGTWTQVGDAA